MDEVRNVCKIFYQLARIFRKKVIKHANRSQHNRKQSSEGVSRLPQFRAQTENNYICNWIGNSSVRWLLC